MPALKLFTPSDILSPADGVDPALNQFKYRFLAQGDSWFSIGTANQFKNANLVEKLTFPKSCCAVNCARPGVTLKRMGDNMQEPNFVNLLCGVKREPWHGILLSAGGNDMIDALGTKDIADPALRLFLTPAEIAGDITSDITNCDSYLSPTGWATFENHIRAVFQLLVNLRDKTTTNRHIPISPSSCTPTISPPYATPANPSTLALGCSKPSKVLISPKPSGPPWGANCSTASANC